MNGNAGNIIFQKEALVVKKIINNITLKKAEYWENLTTEQKIERLGIKLEFLYKHLIGKGIDINVLNRKKPRN
jgi:hypothetical protein